MKKIQNKKSGFSMLELVVVMLIMGTLAGIAISKMGGSDTGAIKASVKSDLRGAIAAVNACYADKLDYQLCDTTAELSPAPVSSTGNTLTITASTAKSDFPNLSIVNATLTTISAAADTLSYDADTSTSIGDFN